MEFQQVNFYKGRPYFLQLDPKVRISLSWLQAALEYKPYIRTEIFEKTSLKTKKWSLEMG